MASSSEIPMRTAARSTIRAVARTSIRAIIVEDEPLGRERIRSLLNGDREIEIIKECANGREAVAAIAELQPDLIFLDVQMPEMNGFEVLESIAAEEMPAVIFVTAYDQYAVKAFEFHALDYLLKSFDPERFAAAVRRAKLQIASGRAEKLDDRIAALIQELQARKPRPERLIIRSGGRIVFLRVADIDWISAADNYVCLHTGQESHLLRETMSNIEARLDPDKFIRLHRSTIVNLDRVARLEPLFHGDYSVLLTDGTELVMSRTYREKLERPLGKFL
jgi:two-component system, LytTR family, response regulator